LEEEGPESEPEIIAKGKPAGLPREGADKPEETEQNHKHV
jgi:hypothetical protein